MIAKGWLTPAHPCFINCKPSRISTMASFALFVEIPENDFGDDEDVIEFRENLASILQETAKSYGLTYGVSASVETLD